MGRSRSISRVASLIRQATADSSSLRGTQADNATNSVLSAVRSYSSSGSRHTEGASILRQALAKSSHGNGTLEIMFDARPHVEGYSRIAMRVFEGLLMVSQLLTYTLDSFYRLGSRNGCW